MRIVDKYELAKLPNGTFFYNLRVSKYNNDDIEEDDTQYDVFDECLHILDGSRVDFIYKDKLFFNGVTDVKPDLDNEDCSNCGFIIEQDLEWLNKRDFDLFNIDTDSNDYNDEDKFLVLERKDVKKLLEILQSYFNEGYNIFDEKGEIKNERSK